MRGGGFGRKAVSFDMSSSVTFLVVLLGGVLLASAATHWGYGEVNGPDSWADLFPDCGGNRQSPVDLTDSWLSEGPHFTWHGYDDVPNTMALINVGHSVKLSSTGTEPRIIKRNGDIFQLDAVHFHWGPEDHEGSEHSIHGKKYTLEMHAVHRHVAENGTILTPAEIIVLATLFEHTAFPQLGDSGLDKFLHHATSVVEAETSVAVDPFAWSKLLHHFTHDFYWYEGSLTTPPCSEVVTFFVPRHDRKVNSEQMGLFRILLDEESEPISGNFRPTQKRNGRTFHFKV